MDNCGEYCTGKGIPLCHNLLTQPFGKMQEPEDQVHMKQAPSKMLLSRFSRVRFCATPQMAAHQAPPSLGFSRQEHWSGVPFPSPMQESEVVQLYLTLSDSMTAAYQAPPSMGFSRQEYWSGVPFPSPMHESEK